ncbi:MAG TPA: hypothetical protein P5142_11915 [Spirochaetia bacterium]|nr:hypothetical protein [Spirochaetia bacterium]
MKHEGKSSARRSAGYRPLGRAPFAAADGRALPLPLSTSSLLLSLLVLVIITLCGV